MTECIHIHTSCLVLPVAESRITVFPHVKCNMRNFFFILMRREERERERRFTTVMPRECFSTPKHRRLRGDYLRIIALSAQYTYVNDTIYL